MKLLQMHGTLNIVYNVLLAKVTLIHFTLKKLLKIQSLKKLSNFVYT